MRIATKAAVYPISVFLALGAASPALAQQSEAQQASDDDAIVVTGSRIARRDYAAESPIVTLDSASLTNTGAPTLESALNQLPQLGISASASANLNNRGGQASVNLRTLGNQRTLVLLDGRRIQPGNSDGAADINVLPSSIIQSAEVITGGASAVYGSDAVTGVVNFKIRRDLEGFEFNARYGVTEYGDGETEDYSVLWGGSFAEGRGNMLLALAHASREVVIGDQRPWRTGLGSPTLPQGNWNVNSSNLPTQQAINDVFAAAGVAPGTVARSARLYFNTDGTLFTQTGPSGPINYRDGFDGLAAPNAIVNNGIVFGSESFVAVQTPLERYNIFSRAEYEIAPGTTLHGQAIYTKYDVTVYRPPGVAGSSSSFIPLSIPTTNPFISPELATLLASRTIPDQAFTITKRTSEGGATYQEFAYDVFGLTIGAEGDITPIGWSWSTDLSYGLTASTESHINYNSSIALNALLNAADGGASLCDGGYNPFGLSPLSQECLTFINRTARSTTDIEQTVFEVNAQGGLFNLPAGRIQAAIGAAYRETSFDFVPDALIATGELAGYLPVQGTSGGTAVTEFYGEALAPLLSSESPIGEVNLSLAYRYSDYDSIGGVSTYKADLDWRPIDSLRLRGGYSRAIRAPSVGELFAPEQLGRAGLGSAGPAASGDPCDVRSAYRAVGAPDAADVRALCLAQGVPTAVIDTYRNLETATPFRTSGNSNLDAETADTFSVGAVYQPRLGHALFSDISFSIDYYSIELDDAVGDINNTLAVQRCFNADGSNPTYDVNNYYCGLITRDTSDGDIGMIDNPKFNLGGFSTDGIDFTADWGIPLSELGGAGEITLRTNINYLLSFEIQTLEGVPFVDYAGTIGNSQIEPFATARPRWKAISSAGYNIGPIDLTLQWRYLAQMENAGNVGTGGAIPDTDAVHYFDLTAGWRLTDSLALRFGVVNLTETDPPVVSIAADGKPTYDVYTYDVIGRRYFLQLTASF